MTPLMHQWLSMVSMVFFMYVGFEVYKMTDEKLKSDYYTPYCDAWKILKTLQHVDETADEKHNEAIWQEYLKQMKEFGNKYPNNSFIEALVQMLIDGGDHISRGK